MMVDDEPFVLDGLSPEIQAMMGVYALYWKVEESIDSIRPDLNQQECHLLLKLDRPKRMGVLACDMMMAPSTITASADTLEQAGHITRQRDPEDRRAWLLVLTDQGEAARSDLVSQAGELFRHASGLNPHETEVFAQLACKIRDNILKTGIPEGLKK